MVRGWRGCWTSAEVTAACRFCSSIGLPLTASGGRRYEGVKATLELHNGADQHDVRAPAEQFQTAGEHHGVRRQRRVACFRAPRVRARCSCAPTFNGSQSLTCRRAFQHQFAPTERCLRRWAQQRWCTAPRRHRRAGRSTPAASAPRWPAPPAIPVFTWSTCGCPPASSQKVSAAVDRPASCPR